MEEDWFLYSITLFAFAVIFTLCYIRHAFTFFERCKLPKGATPGFPFGNISDVVFQNVTLSMHLWKYYNKFKRKKCKLGGFYMFLKPAVVITDPELTTAILDENNDFFKPQKRQNPRKFDGKLIETFMKNFNKTWDNIVKIDAKQVNFTEIMEQCLIENSQKNIFCAEKLDVKLMQSFTNKTSLQLFREILSIPYPSVSSNNSLVDYTNFLEDIILDRKKNDIKKDDVLQLLQDMDVSPNDMVQILLELVINLQRSLNIFNLCLLEISMNEYIQDDLREEILRFKKQFSDELNLEELDKLSYLEALVCEILRKYPVRPLVYKRCQKKFVYGTVTIPENLLVFISIFGIHHDAQNYINPELIDPDRFLEEDEKLIDSSKYLPFGYRNTNTFESTYIKSVIKLGLFRLLSEFQISTGRKSIKSLTFDKSLFELKPKGEMWLQVDTLSN